MSGEHDEARQQISKLHDDAAGDLFAQALLATGGNPDAARDLVQEVFQAAWQSWAKISSRDLSGQRAWLYRTLKNKVVDAYRRSQREVTMDRPELELLRTHERRSAGSSRAAISNVVLDQCWEAIKKMPPVRQKVFMLRALEWTTAEIAEHLRIMPSTVRDHRRDGLRQLNDQIGYGREIFDNLEDEFEDGA